MAKSVKVIMKQRSDTSVNWSASNPVLLAGEIGYDETVDMIKIGDGTKAWNDLDYIYVGETIQPGDTICGGNASSKFNDDVTI